MCILVGGPTLFISLNGKAQPFELHPYCGPCPLSRRDNDTPIAVGREPKGFFDAIERWELGGKQTVGDFCVVPEWCRECSGSGRKVEHVGGRTYLDQGPCEKCNGTRLTK